MPHEIYIKRCFDLAVLGAGSVSPNPMVGAVLVYNNHIIGEGWHRQVGQAHAEVNAVNSVAPGSRHLIARSTLYVSLEPCCIHGRTPPCTDLILRHKIPRVVVSVTDQTPGVQGKGLNVLRQAGVEVIAGVLSKEGAEISAFRNTFVSRERPYILLKFAQSPDGQMGLPGRQVWISNAFAKRWVHKLRATYDAILIGTQTAITDQPELTNRLWFGKSPMRIVWDRDRLVPADSPLLKGKESVWLLTSGPSEQIGDRIFMKKVNRKGYELPDLMGMLFEQGITSLLVEGGARTLQAFLQADLWDEAWVFSGSQVLGQGIPAPSIHGTYSAVLPLQDNVLRIYRNGSFNSLNFV